MKIKFEAVDRNVVNVSCFDEMPINKGFMPGVYIQYTNTGTKYFVDTELFKPNINILSLETYLEKAIKIKRDLLLESLLNYED